MDAIGALSGIALECTDPVALAGFYRTLTGWDIVYEAPDWCSIGAGPDTGFHLSFQRSAGYRPPVWPDPASSMQAHLHVRVTDLDAAQTAACAAGATVFPDQPDPAGTRVLADPAGHPFCLCLRPPAGP